MVPIQPSVSPDLPKHCNNLTYYKLDGRRVVYTASLPVLIFGSLGVATAPNVPSLLFWRFLQSLGASPGLVLGAGVIGDIYKLEERGRAMGIFFVVHNLQFIICSARI